MNMHVSYLNHSINIFTSQYSFDIAKRCCLLFMTKQNHITHKLNLSLLRAILLFTFISNLCFVPNLWYKECYEENKSGGEVDRVVTMVSTLTPSTNITLKEIANDTDCKEECQKEDFCEAFVFTPNVSDRYACSLNTFGTSDEIVKATESVFGFQYCAGIFLI